MVRRGYPPAYLENLTPGEFMFRLEQSLEAAKEEAEAMKKATKAR